MSTTMQAAQMSKPGGDWELVERDIPEPGTGQVRVKVEACGMCHSDVFVKEGLWPGLHQPGGRVHRHGLHDGVAASTAAQLPERFQHRVIGFLAAVALDALPVRDTYVRHVRRSLLQEGIDQGGFPQARLPSEQDDLSLTVHCPVETLA